ncbi:helix-turn-helix transcriptional regulator [Cupriavidus sp. SZY C1]|uniref:helix-turn-helix transcriptional regulator n=1 Tax=Cupriavidus sp. SZY C1 TaxID=3055037 RepID=UPI0028B437E6|nr:helix-turn-helix transcriptional regulator [Cupriavidus sp. SZY C1]MDT6962619.1 helix-turn-helix transcriptional regulator [Cupriavidus sp. SZY C1]
MTEGDMHETIRGLYQGVLDPLAWQRSLYALCKWSGSIQASLLVLDTRHQTVHVRHLVNRAPDNLAILPPPYRVHGGMPFAGVLPVGGWQIDRRDLSGMETGHAPLRGQALDDVALTSVMACLVDRRPTHEIYLALQRPAGEEGYAEADARALDWAIPHLREALALRDRTHAAAQQGHVSADLLNRLPFGVLVFAESGRLLLSNAAGLPWARRLLPGESSEVPGAADGPDHGNIGGNAGGHGNGNGNGHAWRLSRSFADVMRALCDPGSLQPAQAIQATGADGRGAQIVAVALSPSLSLPSQWEGQPVLVAIHESQGPPRAVPAVLRDLYGLTPAENRLAMLLTTGIGLPDACLQLGIKRETGRSQLKAIFTKTSTSTQAQLAHLLTRLASILAEPGGRTRDAA